MEYNSQVKPLRFNSFEDLRLNSPHLIPTSFPRRPLRSRQDLLREFEDEKWGPLYRSLKSSGYRSFESVEREFLSDENESLAFIEGHFILAKRYSTRIRYLALLLSLTVDSVDDDVTGIVEIGSGFGSVINYLSESGRFGQVKYWGLDLSISACEIVQLFGFWQSKDFTAAIFDANDYLKLPEMIGRSTVVITSFTLAYIEKESSSLISDILSRGPRSLIMCEPILDYFENLEEGHSALCKDYFDANAYFGGLLNQVRMALQNFPSYKLSVNLQNIVGENPWCPISIIVLERLDSELH